jgi:ATP-dependent Lon protease
MTTEGKSPRKGRSKKRNKEPTSSGLDSINDTSEVILPNDPMDRVIGQEDAVTLAKVAAGQRRHLLLVGPPGTGKSMIAQALALHLPPPRSQVYVVSNPEYPERPFIQVKSKEDVQQEEIASRMMKEKLISPVEAPVDVAEKLGYRCAKCGTYSPNDQPICPNCQSAKSPEKGPKVARVDMGMNNMLQGLEDILKVTLNQLGGQKNRVQTTRLMNGKEEVVVYESAGAKIRVLDQRALEARREKERASPKKILIPLKRQNFIMATGASETELLGDVRHDPYGGHKGLGTPPFERVVPGAIHEAHEGVLFIDELPHLGPLQRFILTAMQEKMFSISGRNPQSAGASVKVDNVPCDFVFVGACNIQDLHHIISPLRSRITGSGYEILVANTMPDNTENRGKFLQFVAQEIRMDGRIPHAENRAVEELIKEARRRARILDKKKKALTLRLRDMGGVIRAAGDIAVSTGHEFITSSDVIKAIERAKTAEEQIKERFGAYQGAVMNEMSESQSKQISPYNYWNENSDDIVGYE